MREAAVEALFTAHVAEVLAYARRRTDAATAEEVASEVFLVALRRPERIPADEPVLWLYGVARRVLANQRRAARRREALTARLSGLVRERPAEGPELDGRLGTALGALRPADRELLLLTAWEELDAPQAARVLGCSVGAVHTRLHRARARLRAELDIAPAPRPEVPIP